MQNVQINGNQDMEEEKEDDNGNKSKRKDVNGSKKSKQ